MILVQIQYWVTLYPAVTASQDVHSLPKGGHMVGVWAVTVEDLNKGEVLTDLKDRYVDPLLRAKAQAPLNVYQLTELEGLRQVRHLLKLGPRQAIPDLTTLQHVEDLEGGFLSIVHNIQCRIIGYV